MQKKQYEVDLKKLINQTGKPSWVKYGYRFLFDEGRYYWNNKPVSINGLQALSLYQRLVMERPPGATVNAQSIYTLRGKYGNKFLTEAMFLSKSHKGEKSYERAY